MSPGAPVEASVTIVRDSSISCLPPVVPAVGVRTVSGLAGDPRLEGRDPLGEPRLLDAPQLRLELAIDGVVVRADGSHVTDRALGDDHQFTRCRRGPAGEGLRLVDQRVLGDAAVHEPDAFGLWA